MMAVKDLASKTKDRLREFEYASHLRNILATGSNKPPNQLFGSVSDDFWYWLNTEGCRKSAALKEILPGMPEERV